MMELPARCRSVTWYGRGPGENYIDRASGYPIGIYHRSVDALGVAYIRPQQNGNRSDVRWFTITDAGGRGLRFESEAGAPLQFTAQKLRDGGPGQGRIIRTTCHIVTSCSCWWTTARWAWARAIPGARRSCRATPFPRSPTAIRSTSCQ